MPSISRFPRRAAALGLALATMLVLVAAPAGAGEVDDMPDQARALVAPFACGTTWQGSTYGGHGSHNWNLDLNRAGDHVDSDLGQPVYAQAAGTVVWFKQTGWNRRAGTYVVIDYGDVTVRYLHLVAGSIPDEVAEIGATVDPGQRIGELGDTGRTSGPHLHLEYWDSTGHEGPTWELPRENHLPVWFDGVPQIATPQERTRPSVSTNCVGDALTERLAEVPLFNLWRLALLRVADRATDRS